MRVKHVSVREQRICMNLRTGIITQSLIHWIRQELNTLGHESDARTFAPVAKQENDPLITTH